MDDKKEFTDNLKGHFGNTGSQKKHLNFYLKLTKLYISLSKDTE